MELEKIKTVNFRNLIDIPSTTYATFGLYRYPAKFIPHIVAYVLEKYGEPGATVFDPFAGYGTAGVVSRIYGYSYEMWDLNPFIEPLHRVATLELNHIGIDRLVEELSDSEQRFIPDWPNQEYWYPEEFLPFLYKRWGFYHSMDNDYRKTLLVLPLIEASRQLSYNDPGRMKLCKSSKSEERVESLREGDWQSVFYKTVTENLESVLQSLQEYQSLEPKSVESTVKGGVDTFTEELEEKKDFLITSPPYMQSQEYMRHAKLNLFWLGYSIDRVRELKGLEIPYRDIDEQPVNSKTFAEFRDGINEDHIRDTYNNYFWGVLGALTRLSEDIKKYLFLFVARPSLRGRPVPIDDIFKEHFTSCGWRHEKTLVDRIDSKQMFSYGNNPATGVEDARAKSEKLVILKRTG